MTGSFWKFAIFWSAFKALLIPSYHSTDFEVHRNWLAITYSLPIDKWYTESTSEWTLDYPPLFAWFEWCLSQIAVLFDPAMLVVSNLNYASPLTVLFQRLSVIVTDLVYIYAAHECCSWIFKHQKSIKNNGDSLSPQMGLFLLMTGNCGLFIVDHIHFQYNGFLFGIMLLSIARICQGLCLEGAFWFSILLNLKHIYLYVAPAYFVFLLRNYCFGSNKDGSLNWKSFSPVRFLSLGMVVIVVFTAALGPTILLGQVNQLLSRLFPFKRGLSHAYWAPNFWALYNGADKVASVIGVKQGWLNSTAIPSASMTSGLVQEVEHVVLPSIAPIVTLLCTGVSILPVVYHLFSRPSGPHGFVRALILCAFGSFMFGWHVHEKAVLIMIIPLTFCAMLNRSDAKCFLLLGTVGHFSLFPLLFEQQESVTKYSLFLAYSAAAFGLIGYYYRDYGTWCRLPLLSTLESLYILGLLPLEIYCSVLHFSLGLHQKLAFLPLLLTSVYCALGATYSWVHFYCAVLRDRTVVKLKHA